MTDFAHYNEVWQEGYYEGFNEGYTKGEKDAALKWIPVSVLLPSKEDAYFVTVEYDGCDGKKKMVTTSDWCKSGFQVSIFSKARVTAWMPRPKPYEGDEEDEDC